MHVLFHGRGAYPNGARIGPNSWPHHDLLVAQRGAITMEVGRGEITMGAGDALLIPPGTQFSGEGRTTDAAIWVLHYRGYRAVEESVRAPRGHPALFRQALRSTFAANLLNEITLAAASGSLRDPYVNALAVALLARLAMWRPLGAEEVVEQNRLLPNKSRDAMPRRVADLARGAGLCGSHYRARFLKAFGETPRQYLQNLKVTKARRLLLETRLPIKEIAERVGYADVVAFHRAFAAANACTPGKYRQKAPLVA
jgi:AraC-like DNA-binding protein